MFKRDIYYILLSVDIVRLEFVKTGAGKGWN